MREEWEINEEGKLTTGKGSIETVGTYPDRRKPSVLNNKIVGVAFSGFASKGYTKVPLHRHKDQTWIYGASSLAIIPAETIPQCTPSWVFLIRGQKTRRRVRYCLLNMFRLLRLISLLMMVFLALKSSISFLTLYRCFFVFYQWSLSIGVCLAQNLKVW